MGVLPCMKRYSQLSCGFEISFLLSEDQVYHWIIKSVKADYDVLVTKLLYPHISTLQNLSKILLNVLSFNIPVILYCSPRLSRGKNEFQTLVSESQLELTGTHSCFVFTCLIFSKLLPTLKKCTYIQTDSCADLQCFNSKNWKCFSLKYSAPQHNPF